MFSKDEIKIQLRAGKPAEEIAKAMETEINTALAEYNAEQESAKAKTKERETDTYALVDSMMAYFHKHFGQKELTNEERARAAEAIISMGELLINLDNAIQKAEEKSAAKSKSSDDDIIAAWLNALC